ncbi:MAG: hypothetical protein QG657_151 [Acidobacteriota bacterium]|nr:hypothetical protein [Acidobacteriota bacterium]
MPDHVAVFGHGLARTTLSYNELNEQSGRLAGLLIEKGVLADSIIDIMVDRSINTIIGIMGILKAGGAYLPIDPVYPQERIDYMLKDSGAKLLAVANDQEGEKVRRWEGENVLLEELSISLKISSYPLTFLPSYLLNHSNLAYIIYTSGSTGKPKGVMVEHRNVVRLVKNTNYVEFRENDRLLQTGALEFDASTFEIWGSLLNGMTLYLVPKEDVLMPEQLKGHIRRYDICTIWLTSSLFNQLVQIDVELFVGLRNLLVGGDVLSPVYIGMVMERYPGLNIINGYGPTENTTFSTTYRVSRPYESRIPIGRPIANSTAFVVDKTGRLSPVGIAGELWVGGAVVGQRRHRVPGAY